MHDRLPHDRPELLSIGTVIEVGQTISLGHDNNHKSDCSPIEAVLEWPGPEYMHVLIIVLGKHRSRWRMIS